MVNMLTKIENEILSLKKEKNVLLLAHFYEDGAIQDVADFVGDSLFLAQKGSESDAPIILLAGVVFMGESVKILSPNKKVIVPDLNAGCSLVHSSPYEKYKKWKDENPNSIVMTYVNSSAEVKSLSDVICTSSNAEKIVNAIPKEKTILFGPDKHLGRWLAKKSGRTMKFWEGSCEVHILFSAQKLFALKQDYPNALVLAHPECDDGVLSLSDVVGSTSKLLETVTTGKNKQQYIVATEDGIFHQMRKARPDAELIQAPVSNDCPCNQCPYMKLNTLEKIRDALKTLSPEIKLSQKLVESAQIPLKRMMQISKNQPVSWN